MQFLSFLHHSSIGLLILRLGVGAVFLVHGRQKWAMWKMQPSAQMSGRMLTLMKFLSLAEPLGSLAVIIGLLTQFAAMGLSLVMLGAIYLKITAWQKKFSGDNGWEFEFILLCAALSLILSGGGAIALDRIVFGI